MNDSLKGKNNKVRVMYVRKDDQESPERPTRTSSRNTGAGAERAGERRNRHERGDRPARREGPSASPDSPWKTRYQDSDQTDVPDHGGISGKSLIDPEQLRRQRAEETRIYGENACQALFRHRPDAIVRAWFLQAVTPRFRDALRWMAANRKAYHVVDGDELVKASGTEHHGGVCFLVKKRAGLDVEHYLRQADDQDCVLVLAEVKKPYNLGAILRSCAYFGVKGVMADDGAALESGAAVRTAEGGAESVSAIHSDDLAADLDRFRRAGYAVIGHSAQRGTPLASLRMPAKTVLIIGEEGGWPPEDLLNTADTAASIGGAGQGGGLNISVATGILLAEWRRQNP
ncbi:tRNA/rRNA methyltransferase [Martelella alba]|uniref:tRNA/rRNA methyltransferase n=1 Tax=Martelella alba TaxID=2590451 RepID=A0ABY2SIQ0_9HYPH|nr:tRNA/rRNA methyltransferase [Martelella alba]TKI05290.1 tRNA/rRNA methyltransferase [Martelella alba]